MRRGEAKIRSLMRQNRQRLKGILFEVQTDRRSFESAQRLKIELEEDYRKLEEKLKKYEENNKTENSSR